MPQKYIRSSESCHSSTNFKDKQLITERISEKRSSLSVKKHTIRRNQNPDPSQTASGHLDLKPLHHPVPPHLLSLFTPRDTPFSRIPRCAPLSPKGRGSWSRDQTRSRISLTSERLILSLPCVPSISTLSRIASHRHHLASHLIDIETHLSCTLVQLYDQTTYDDHHVLTAATPEIPLHPEHPALRLPNCIAQTPCPCIQHGTLFLTVNHTDQVILPSPAKSAAFIRSSSASPAISTMGGTNGEGRRGRYQGVWRASGVHGREVVNKGERWECCAR